MFSREACLPACRHHVPYQPPCQDTELPVAEYVSHLHGVLREAYETVYSQVGGMQEHQEQLYNQNVHGEPHKSKALV